MAELNIQFPFRGKRSTIRRAKKLSTKVDLTPMVDLGFLLITFFIVTTTWISLKSMLLFLPANGDRTRAPESASLSIIPLNDNKVFYYHGSLQNAIHAKQYGVTNYSVDGGIDEIIRQKQFNLDKNKFFKKGRREMVVMIKPSAISNFANVIKVLDEMLINKVSKYSLMDLDEEEKKFLKEEKLAD